MITFLDVSYCGKIGARALEAIGKNCKLLVGLCRNLHPLDTAGKPLQDDEAYAIASTMPKLKHLEVAYHLISTTSVLKILSSCPELGFLDLRGCWDVKLDDQFLKDKFPKLKVLGPLVIDYYERNDWDDCSDSSGAYEYMWEFVAGEMGEFDEDEDDESYWDDEGRLEELELRFYEGNNEDAELYGWPPSP